MFWQKICRIFVSFKKNIRKILKISSTLIEPPTPSAAPPAPAPPPASTSGRPGTSGASLSRSVPARAGREDYLASRASNDADIFESRLYFMSVLGMDDIYFTFWCQTLPERLHVYLDRKIFLSFVCTKVDCVGL